MVSVILGSFSRTKGNWAILDVFGIDSLEKGDCSFRSTVRFPKGEVKGDGEFETGTGIRFGYREILYSFLIWRERLEVRRAELNHNLPSSGGRHVQLTSFSSILLDQSELLSNGREAFTIRANSRVRSPPSI